ncbi:MAG TPA: hypothetical protein VFE58_03710 [Tepidisphaeraceae bacterium]|nr:hypothetical protein [Tepidisphaeraceae bacterium]
MKVLGLTIVAAVLCMAAGEPATAPTWSHTPTGDVILRPFASAPYPHASRANGLTSSNGTFPRDPNYVDSTVGIVIPPGYVAGETVDYVVHFHGWSNHVSQVLSFYQLPEQLAAAKVNAILLVPQGPKDAKDSGDGKLELDKDGFKHLIEEVTAFLNAQGKIHTSKVGHIVLTAHSGGYKVTARILDIGGMTEHITDVILLDASYGNLDDFYNYVMKNKNARLISFHTQHLDKENLELKGLFDKTHEPMRDLAEGDISAETLMPRGVTFISTQLAHNDVPMKKSYFSLCVGTSELPKIP